MTRTLKFAIFVSSIFLSPLAHAEFLSLTNHDVDWALVINAPGFALEQKSVDGPNVHFTATNENTQLAVSGSLEKGLGRGTAKACREYHWHNLQHRPLQFAEVKMTEAGETAMLEYLVPEFEGVPIHQKSKIAYYVRGDYWLYIQVSKDLFQEPDEPLFSAVLTNAGFAQKDPLGKWKVTYKVAEEKSVTMDVPQGWIDEVGLGKEASAPTIEFSPEEKGGSSKVMVTPILIQEGGPDFRDPELIRMLLEEMGEKVLSNAVEKEISLNPIQGNAGSGFHYTITDKRPQLPPGEYRYMTQGGINVDGLLVMFTVFTNEKGPPVVREALEMIAGARS
jgi:hypothetical protein